MVKKYARKIIRDICRFNSKTLFFLTSSANVFNRSATNVAPTVTARTQPIYTLKKKKDTTTLSTVPTPFSTIFSINSGIVLFFSFHSAIWHSAFFPLQSGTCCSVPKGEGGGTFFFVAVFFTFFKKKKKKIPPPGGTFLPDGTF